MDKSAEKTKRMMLYLFPFKLTATTGLRLIKFFDTIIAIIYVANFNMSKNNYFFILNILFIAFFLILTFLSSCKPSKIVIGFYKYVRIFFFVFSFIVHFIAVIQLIMNRHKLLEDFYLSSKFKPFESEFNAIITKLILVTVSFIYIDLIHLSWSLFLTRMLKPSS